MTEDEMSSLAAERKVTEMFFAQDAARQTALKYLVDIVNNRERPHDERAQAADIILRHTGENYGTNPIN